MVSRRSRSVRLLPTWPLSAWTLPAVLALALLAAVARPTPALAQRSDTALLVVANLNFDCYPDSVFGVRNGALRYLPTHIAWGRFDPLRAERCPQDSQTTRSAEPKLYARTDFVYPDWLSVGGSVALQNLNEDDSLTDVCLYLWGKYRTGNQTRDTMLVLAIFGQTDLQSQKRIELSTIGVFQSEPYYAMQLRAGEEFVKPGIRDLSRVKSYELPRVKVKVRREKGKDTTATDTVSVRDSTVIAPEGRSGDYVVKVYPNPTPERAQVEARSLPAGEYRVEVISVNGRRVYGGEVSVGEGGELFESLDLGGVSSGYYVVRLYTGTRLVGTYPIMIVR